MTEMQIFICVIAHILIISNPALTGIYSTTNSNSKLRLFGSNGGVGCRVGNETIRNYPRLCAKYAHYCGRAAECIPLVRNAFAEFFVTTKSSGGRMLHPSNGRATEPIAHAAAAAARQSFLSLLWRASDNAENWPENHSPSRPRARFRGLRSRRSGAKGRCAGSGRLRLSFAIWPCLPACLK